MEIILQEFEKWMKRKDLSSHTIARYKIVAKQFIQWHNKQVSHSPFDPSLVETEDIIRWRNAQIKGEDGNRKLKITTIINKLESLKTFFRFLQERGSIKYSPAAEVKQQKYSEPIQEHPKWLKSDELRDLEIYINDHTKRRNNRWTFLRDRALVYTMLFAGLRVNEIARLKVDDIYAKALHIRNSKGNKSRDIYMNSDLSYYIGEWLKVRNQFEHNHDFLFVSARGNPLAVSSIEYLFQKFKSETNIPRLHPHTLRHTFCKTLYDRTHDLELVASLAGHNDLDTTRVYVTSSSDERRDALENLSSGDFKNHLQENNNE